MPEEKEVQNEVEETVQPQEGEIDEEQMENVQGGGGGYQSPYQGQNSYENAADHGTGGARPR